MLAPRKRLAELQQRAQAAHAAAEEAKLLYLEALARNTEAREANTIVINQLIGILDDWANKCTSQG